MEKNLTIRQDIFPEINALQVTKGYRELVAMMPEHKAMLETISAAMPEVQRSTSLFYKTQSQFMDNMMTVSHYTPIRNLRQILAEMNNTREALKEAHFKLKKKEIELRQKVYRRDRIVNGSFTLKDEDGRELDEIEIENAVALLDTEIAEILSQADTTRGYISGAIRKLANYTEQYNSIVAKYGLEKFNEADFEREEERYHIMKAFEQATCAARARGGMIDEGNQIYFAQIGINGATAQYYLSEFLAEEAKLLAEGKAPLHQMFREFLERMANIFAGSAKDLAESKGMTPVSEVALIKEGDTRMLLKHQPEPEKEI